MSEAVHSIKSCVIVIVFTVNNMSLADATSQFIVERVLQLTRRRQFLVWYTDTPATREIGLPIPQETTPPSLKRLLIRFNPTQNQELADLVGQLLTIV